MPGPSFNDIDRLKQRVDRLSALAKALSDPNRLRILLTVAAGRKSVSQVVERVGLSQPLVSHHLKELRLAGLVAVERDGPFVFYELIDSRVVEVLAGLAELTD